MKKLLLLLVLLPCLTWAQQVTYSGVSVFSILTSGDTPPEITISAGCVLDGVSYAQAQKLGLVSVGLDSTTNTISTTFTGYDPLTLRAVVIIPIQTFSLPNAGLTSDQYKGTVKSYIVKRYKVYAEEVMTRYFSIPSVKGSMTLDGSVSPLMQVKNQNSLENKYSTNIKNNKSNLDLGLFPDEYSMARKTR